VSLNNIYTYGGLPAKRNVTMADLIASKGTKKYTQTTAVDQEEAAACEAVGIDIVSIWDRDIHAVCTGAPNTFVLAGLSMTDYQTADQILAAGINAAAAGADLIYTPRGFSMVEMLANEGLSVQGHIGLVPRRSTQFGGLRAVGRTAKEATELMHLCRRYEDAGAAAVEVECVPTAVLAEISARTTLLTHSIGSGGSGDIIFMFLEDICGDTVNPPRHAKAFSDLQTCRQQLSDERMRGLAEFKSAVASGSYPGGAHSIAMPDTELAKFREALETMKPLHR